MWLWYSHRRDLAFTGFFRETLLSIGTSSIFLDSNFTFINAFDTWQSTKSQCLLALFSLLGRDAVLSNPPFGPKSSSLKCLLQTTAVDSGGSGPHPRISIHSGRTLNNAATVPPWHIQHFTVLGSSDIQHENAKDSSSSSKTEIDVY